MKNIFVNFTNHPSSLWEEFQLKEAKKYGEIVDLKFPDIDPKNGDMAIQGLADTYVKKISDMEATKKVVHIMGEMCFTYCVVRKLQQLGIQCVASTTVRNTVTLEDGSKVSKFNFEQFRPYSKIRNKNDTIVPKSKLAKRDYFSIVALALVLVGEIAFLLKVNGLVGCFSYWIIFAAVALIIVLALVGLMLGERFNIRSVNLTKLFANAIAPRRLGVLYLFFFVLHLGWLTNAIMNLFIPTGIFAEVAISMCVCLVGMLTIVAFFPDGRIKKDEKASKVFVSGLSPINNKIHNLTPLIRMLQLANDENDNCEMLILHSDYYSDPKNTKWIEDNFKLYVQEICAKLTDDSQRAEFQEEIKNSEEIKQKLKILIRQAAMLEFPEKKWIKDKLTITFTDKEADYSDFNNCYEIISKPIKERDDANHEMYFNLTPGTNSAGSLMTLMAIDGSRRLFYYIPQDVAKQSEVEDEATKRIRLVEVDKNSIPLSSLLSQALDSIM